MSELADRITAIIEEHLICECGNWAEDMHQNCAHVAERLVAELHLEDTDTFDEPGEVTLRNFPDEPGAPWE